MRKAISWAVPWCLLCPQDLSPAHPDRLTIT